MIPQTCAPMSRSARRVSPLSLSQELLTTFSMKIPTAVIVFLMLQMIALAADPPGILTAKPRDGVYARGDIFSATVLELKDGHFRYWFESDLKSKRDPEYPLTGDYVFEGDKVVLNNARISVGQRTWTFRMREGEVILLRPSAVDVYDHNHELEAWGVLYPTKKTAEEAWGHKESKPSISPPPK